MPWGRCRASGFGAVTGSRGRTVQCYAPGDATMGELRVLTGGLVLLEGERARGPRLRRGHRPEPAWPLRRPLRRSGRTRRRPSPSASTRWRTGIDRRLVTGGPPLRRWGNRQRALMDRLPAEAEELCAASPYDFSDLKARLHQLHAQALARGLQHRGPRRSGDDDHAPQRRRGRADPRRRPRHRDRRLAGHDRARLGARRLAGDLREGDGRRHPRAADADLARREVVGLHAGDRAPLRQQPPAQRARASTPTTAASAAAWSPATRTASSTAR